MSIVPPGGMNSEEKCGKACNLLIEYAAQDNKKSIQSRTGKKNTDHRYDVRKQRFREQTQEQREADECRGYQGPINQTRASRKKKFRGR